MKIGAIIFSRFDSKRLPGKALIDIHGRSLLGRVLDRTKGITNLDKIIIATTERVVDDVIAGFAESEGIDCFRGSLDDVVSRALRACESFDLDGFVRVCGDRPFFDPELITSLVLDYKKLELDLATTTGAKQLPPGLTGEVVRVSALKDIVLQLDAYDKEHLTSYFYRHPESFKIKAFPPPSYIQPSDELRLVVDDEQDLARARWIASHLTDSMSNDTCMSQVISLATQWDANNLHIRS